MGNSKSPSGQGSMSVKSVICGYCASFSNSVSTASAKSLSKFLVTNSCAVCVFELVLHLVFRRQDCVLLQPLGAHGKILPVCLGREILLKLFGCHIARDKHIKIRFIYIFTPRLNCVCALTIDSVGISCTAGDNAEGGSSGDWGTLELLGSEGVASVGKSESASLSSGCASVLGNTNSMNYFLF